MRSLLLNGTSIFGEGGGEPTYAKLKPTDDDRAPTSAAMKASEKQQQQQQQQHRDSLSHSPSGSGGAMMHRVQEAPLRDVDVDAVYDVRRVLADGCYARVLLAHHRNGDADSRTQQTQRVALRCVYAELTHARDFHREFHYAYRLSPHPAVLDTYDVAFRTLDGCYAFAQEYAPHGDLGAHLARLGALPERACKLVVEQLSGALDFVHSHALVHRDVRPESVLVFAADCSRVKLGAFGAMRREGTLVTKQPRGGRAPFLAPEVHETLANERHACQTASDVWQLGAVAFACLAGGAPWQMADAIRDPAYAAFARYQKRRTTHAPGAFARLAPRALRMFRRLFEPKPEKRAPAAEALKYVKDAWLERAAAGGGGGGGGRLQTSSSCSRIAAPQERKDSIRLYLRQHGGRNSLENGKGGIKRVANGCGGLETSSSSSSSEHSKEISKRVWEWVLSCDVNAEHVEGI